MGKGQSFRAKQPRFSVYGVRSPGPGSDIVVDVVEWFATRAAAEQFIAEVAGEPNPEDAVLTHALSVVEVDLLGPDAAQPCLS